MPSNRALDLMYCGHESMGYVIAIGLNMKLLYYIAYALHFPKLHSTSYSPVTIVKSSLRNHARF
jgi:hypothetical protein